MKTIKVFHIMTSGLRREGISSTQLEFFRHMDQGAFKIFVAAVCDNDQEMIREFERIGCKVIEFPNRRKQTVRYFWKLISVMREMKPDIVHIHGSSAVMCIELLAAKMTGIRIRIAHSRNTTADHAKADRILRPLFNSLYTDGMACGEDAGRWLFGDKTFTVIHNGKDFQKFTYDEGVREVKRRELGLTDKMVVGHVGRINNQKNHEFLLKVFNEFQRKHTNAILYLMGNGELIGDVKQQAERMEIADKVIFAGSVEDVAERLQAMDIMVFPSRYEGLPNVVLEWQAEGLPCLISDRITQECIVTDWVEYASIDDAPLMWVDKMEQMLNKYTDRGNQAKQGIFALKQRGFDIEDSAKQLEDIYLKLVHC